MRQNISEKNFNRDARLKELLRQELGDLPGDDSIDAFLQDGKYRQFRKGEHVISMHSRCSDVLIILDGIVRFVDIDRGSERTISFGMPGTILMSRHSFVMDLPSYYTVEACTQSCLWCTSRENFWKSLKKYPDLCMWMLRYAYAELYYQEYRNANIHNGDARERYRNLIVDRPQIIRNVPQNIIASYLGITPEYLSKLKSEYCREKR